MQSQITRKQQFTLCLFQSHHLIHLLESFADHGLDDYH